MRIGQFVREAAEEPWAGVVDEDTVVNLAEAGLAAGVDLPRRTVDVLSVWDWRAKVDLAVAFARETGVGTYDPAELTRRAPVTDPRKVICVGLNYADHAGESGGEVPERPILFAKFPTCIVGPDEPVTWDPSLTQAVDYEAELVVVIGEETRDIDPEAAREHVAGYTVGNDVSARDLQFGDEQWVRGKSLDTFAPLGPELVTPDAFDPHDAAIWTELDGERLQDASTRQLVFDTDELVAFCSRAFTLEPGDLIFTGTPDGVGYFRDPTVLLDDGDEITVGVEGIGTLSNPCLHQG